MTKGSDVLSSSSTLVNLACLGRWDGAFMKGTYSILVGDSQAGKTFFTLALLAEAAANPKFRKYRLIYDDVENGALMNREYFFGAKLVDRLESPSVDDDGNACNSVLADDFYFAADEAMKDDGRCVYVVDSMDALTTMSEVSKFYKRKRARKEGTSVSGTMTDGKAQGNSRDLRQVLSRVRDTNSILVLVSQTRDKIGGGLFEQKKTRAGGHALTFYATCELWLSISGRIKSTVNKRVYPIGVMCRVRVKKNRVVGRDRTVDVPIYYDYGIDDIGSCCKYLCDNKHWKSGEGKVVAPEFDYAGSKSGLIRAIEERNQEDVLRQLVQQVWEEIERKLTQDRKRRYV